MTGIIDTIKKKLSFLKPITPYGVFESWDDLNPRLYHGVHVFWLKVYGVWYFDYLPKTLKFWSHVLYMVCVLLLTTLLPYIGEIIYLHKWTKNVGDVAQSLYLFLTELYTYFKLTAFWLNRKRVLALLKYLHRDEFKPKEQEHRDIIFKSIKTSRNICNYYLLATVGSLAVAFLSPVGENFEVLPTDNIDYVIFDVHKRPMYWILYVHHVFYMPASCIIDGVMDTILAAFITTAIAQLDVLAFNLRNFEMIADRRRQRDIRDNKYIEERSKLHYVRSILRECIMHHNSIIRYVDMIQDAFSIAAALQFMLSAMILCLIGVQILSIENPLDHLIQLAWTGIYLTCMCIEVFIMCLYGDELMVKSVDLVNAAYDGPWTNFDRSTNMYIIILMERSQQPLSVTAGKVFPLSRNSYTVLIDWAYKAFAIMKNMK